MKIVIQRVSQAEVRVEGTVVSSIGRGMLLLVCMEKGDNEGSLDLGKVAEKVANLRIFQDPESGKMNKNIEQHGGEFLCVSQFTLSWDGKKGNRPSFDNSLEPSAAVELFDSFCEELGRLSKVKKGVFGASMEVSLVNDGPVTFSLNF